MAMLRWDASLCGRWPEPGLMTSWHHQTWAEHPQILSQNEYPEDNTPLMSPLAVMVFNVALKPSGAISNSLLLISTALKSRGNLCGYSNEQAATVRSCSQGLRKQRFLSTWVMQSVLFLSGDSLWLNVGAFSLALEAHHKFLTLLQQTAICKLWWSDQNYYCAEYILLSFNPGLAAACRLRPLHLTYWVLTCYPDPISGYGGWHSSHRGQALNSPQTSHNSKLSFHDWIKIRKL